MPNPQRQPQAKKGGGITRLPVEIRPGYAMHSPAGDIEVLELQLPLANYSGSTISRLIERIKSL